MVEDAFGDAAGEQDRQKQVKNDVFRDSFGDVKGVADEMDRQKRVKREQNAENLEVKFQSWLKDPDIQIVITELDDDWKKFERLLRSAFVKGLIIGVECSRSLIEKVNRKTDRYTRPGGSGRF